MVYLYVFVFAFKGVRDVFPRTIQLVVYPTGIVQSIFPPPKQITTLPISKATAEEFSSPELFEVFGIIHGFYIFGLTLKA